MNKGEFLGYSLLAGFITLGACLGFSIGAVSADKRWLKQQEKEIQRTKKSLEEREQRLNKKEEK